MLNYAIEQRLRLIDFLLAQYGSVGRNELMIFFGISSAQATRDFKQYMEMAGDNALLNRKSRRYVRADTFESIFNEKTKRDFFLTITGRDNLD